jgi:predicted Zn-dependent protease
MRVHRTLLPLLLLVTTVACSTNPATGKREFNLVSEQQEIAIGQESHPQIIQQFGVYDEKPELNRLVQQVGARLASESARPNLPWHFTILDTPMVNAMALPGGYVYITRGMLERINSTDELAGVLGHEIAHVTARHSAQQISRQQVAQLGMVLGAVVAGPEVAQQYGQLAQLGLGLLFQKYSRGQESQADLIGTEYVAKSAYNPIGAERMLMTLQRLDKNPGGGLDRYFQSHPDPAKRVADVHQKVQELGGMASGSFPEPNHDEFLRAVDGVITANSTENVVIRDNTIYDREHGLILPIPSGWEAVTAQGMLFVLQPRDGSNVSFQAQEVSARELQGSNAQNAVRTRFQQMGLQFAGSREARAGSGERFTVDVWTGQTQAGAVAVETTQFVHGDHVAVFLFVAPSVSRTQSPLGTMLDRSRIDVARARSIQPPRIRVGTVRSGEGWAEIARRATGNTQDAEAVANMNGFDLSDRPQTGMTVKLPEEVVRDSR